jgi:diketogulonate reductase-like aldo/keto reductase
MSSTESSKTTLLNCPTIPLRDGTKHPLIGFGTYKVGFIPASASSVSAATTTASPAPTQVERTAEECVSDALDVGYRFLECAEFYGNEAEVGKAIAKSGIDRKDLYICSKVWTTTIEKGPAAVRAQLEQTLKDLQTTYVDLYLIHWPVPVHHVEAYKTLVELQKEGKVKGIGVSNYGKSGRLSISVLYCWIPLNIGLFPIRSTNRFTCFSLGRLRRVKGFGNHTASSCQPD